MVLRVSKSARVSGRLPSVQPVRVTPDVPTTAPATQQTRDAKATAPPPTPPTIKPIPPPTPPPATSGLTEARTSMGSVRVPVSEPRSVQVVQPAVRVPEPSRVIESPIPFITPSVIYSEPVVAPPIKQQPQPQPQPQPIEIPLVPGTSGFLGGISTIPLTAGAVATMIQPKQPEQPGTLEGFKPTTSKGGEEALDISDKVLAEEVTQLPTEYYEEVIPGGAPSFDPATGITTYPGDTIVTSAKGGEVIKSTIGKSEVKPDYSDPLGSLFGGSTQSISNELIGIKNIGALATGKEQEGYFATPSGLIFGGIAEAGISAASDIGGYLFDIGRTVAGKAPVQVGQSVTTFGIGGDKVTIQQQPKRGDAYQILADAGERAGRIAQADPFYALGDALVQIPLLVVAPVKAVSVGLKTIGATAKAVKGLTTAGKAEKLFSATGAKVTQIKPKTSIASSFTEEYGKAEAKIIQAERIEDYSSLSDIQRANLQASQRGQFEQVVENLQKGKGAIGETTAEFAGQSKPGRLIPVPKAEAEKQAIEFFAKQGRTDLIPENLQRAIQPQGEGLFGRLAGTAGSPPATKAQKAIERDFQDLIKLQTKLDEGKPLTLRESNQLERFASERVTKIAKAAEEGPQGLIGGIRKEGPKVFDDIGPPRLADELQFIQRFGGGPSGGLSKIDPGLGGGDVFSSTIIDLGRGTGRFGDDLGGIAGVGKGGDDFFGGVGDVGKGATKSQIDEFSKKTGIPSDHVEKVIRKGEIEYGSGTVQQFLKTQADDIGQEVAKSQKLFELEKARKALQKTKSASKAISSIEDQATQRKLSDLIKLEKAKKPSTTADKATQAALRKLINEEKAKIATKTLAKVTKADETLDILRTKPRAITSVADDFTEQVIRKPGSKLEVGALGGIATGVAIGSAVGLGIGVDQLNKPKILEDQQLFNQEISRQINDPTFSRQVFEPVITQKQTPKLRTDYFTDQQQTTRFDQQQNQRITDIFQTPQRTTTKQTQQTNIFEQQIYQPSEETITQSELLYPPGGGFPFGGNRADVVGEEKTQRKFYRLFDIAKTPFGRVEIGLGAQIQSDRPIFEISEERPNRNKKNIGERFFSLDPKDYF